MYSAYGAGGDGQHMAKSLFSWNPLRLPNSALNPALWRYKQKLNVYPRINFQEQRSTLHQRVQAGYCTLNELIEKPTLGPVLATRPSGTKITNGAGDARRCDNLAGLRFIYTDSQTKTVERTVFNTPNNRATNIPTSGCSQDKIPGLKSPKTNSERLFLERFQKILDKTVQLYDDLYQNKGPRFRYSRDHYQTAIKKLLEKSRKFFFQLESKAVREILTTNKKWESTADVENIFNHDYLTMAENLAMHLLQLILAYSDRGFVCVDQAEPLSLASYYRGEFRLGQAMVMSGVYQIHVQSFQYTTLTNLLQLSNCPLQSVKIGHKSKWKGNLSCNEFENLDIDIFDRAFHDGKSPRSLRDEPMTSEEIEDTSQYLKILRWQVCFKQNPDQEDESYYLCCKAIRPQLKAPKYIFQSDSVNYYFGKFCSPKMNFQNPSIDEIFLDCRPVGRFDILHYFGIVFPTYHHVIGVLVDYLRHKRFKRTIF